MVNINFDLSAIDFSADPEPEAEILIPEVVEETETLPALPTFSTHDVAVRSMQYEQEIKLMEEDARTITIIEDESTNTLVAEKGLRAKRLYKRLDELEEYFKRPHLDYIQKARNFFADFKKRLKAIDASMGRLESAYARIKENKRRIAEAEAKKAAEAQTATLAQEAQEAAAQGVEYVPITVVPQVIPQEPTVIHTTEGTSSQRKKWKGTIIDPAQVPREYCEPSQKLVNDAVKGGVREIAGCKIEEDMSTVRRV